MRHRVGEDAGKLCCMALSLQTPVTSSENLRWIPDAAAPSRNDEAAREQEHNASTHPGADEILHKHMCKVHI